jgi:Ni,Fe-hydrogenase I small subunit
MSDNENTIEILREAIERALEAMQVGESASLGEIQAAIDLGENRLLDALRHLDRNAVASMPASGHTWASTRLLEILE